MSRDLSGLGLDELMIVNPDADGLRAVLRGKDGALYGVEDAGPLRYYLGAHGALYELAGEGPGGLSDPGAGASGFFLGDDGTLYQVTSEPRR